MTVSERLLALRRDHALSSCRLMSGLSDDMVAGCSCGADAHRVILEALAQEVAEMEITLQDQRSLLEQAEKILKAYLMRPPTLNDRETVIKAERVIFDTCEIVHPGITNKIGNWLFQALSEPGKEEKT